MASVGSSPLQVRTISMPCSFNRCYQYTIKKINILGAKIHAQANADILLPFYTDSAADCFVTSQSAWLFS